MTDQLRTRAVIEAKRLNLDAPHHVGFVEGFIVGRMSVTRESIARRLAALSTGGVCAPDDPSLAWETWLSEADAMLALLREEEAGDETLA